MTIEKDKINAVINSRQLYDNLPPVTGFNNSHPIEDYGIEDHSRCSFLYSKFDIYQRRLRSKLGDPDYDETHENYKTIPDEIYLIYISLDADKKLEVRQFRYVHHEPLAYGKIVQDKISEMARSVLAQFSDHPPVLMAGMENTDDVNFQNLKFRKPCYLAFILNEDSKDWRFHNSQSNQYALQFIVRSEPIFDSVTVRRQII